MKRLLVVMALVALVFSCTTFQPSGPDVAAITTMADEYVAASNQVDEQLLHCDNANKFGRQAIEIEACAQAVSIHNAVYVPAMDKLNALNGEPLEIALQVIDDRGEARLAVFERTAKILALEEANFIELPVSTGGM